MADGNDLVIGENNQGESTTQLVLVLTSTADPAFMVSGSVQGGTAIRAIGGPGVHGTGGNFGVLGDSQTGAGVRGESPPGPGVLGESDTGPGVRGLSKSDDGVFGQGPTGVHGNSDTGVGVRGTSKDSVGVLGRGRPGVLGQGAEDGGTGVEGDSDSGAGVFGTVSTGVGVFGRAPQGIGVQGQSATQQGILGQSESSSGVEGTSISAIGVRGFSGTGIGLYGTAGKPAIVFPQNSNTGVHGHASTGIGVRGVTASGVGLHARALSPAGKAAVFEGAVEITGSLTVNGNNPKSIAVRFPDGSYHRMYCQESPESWLEDFGEGTLAKGRAEIKIDADFAKAVDLTRKYHVFVTPHDSKSKGLAVVARLTDHFVVEEQGGGDSTFSYRLVARRGDIEGRRFEHVEVTRPELPPGTGEEP